VLFYGVVSDSTEEAVELVPTREEAEALVLTGVSENECAGGSASRALPFFFLTGSR
jgi:hypothetical protein